MKGFSLIEVLVTFIILSVGLLGVAQLQTIATKESVDSDQRAQALFLIHGLTERMRANVEGQLNGYTAAAADANLCNAEPAKMCSDYLQDTTKTAADASCSADEMARFDIWELKCGFDRTDIISGSIDQLILTGAGFQLTCTDSDTTDGDLCSVGSDFNVVLNWRSVSAGAASSNETDAKAVTFVVRP